MKPNELRIRRRLRRRAGLRKRIRGTSERPRLTVTRSHKNIGAQIIDDERGVTLCAVSSRDKGMRDTVKYGGNIEAAKAIGTLLAERAKAANITAVCFDRNGYKFHGRVKGLADAVREGGIAF